jgi:hypothetical protein
MNTLLALMLLAGAAVVQGLNCSCRPKQLPFLYNNKTFGLYCVNLDVTKNYASAQSKNPTPFNFNPLPSSDLWNDTVPVAINSDPLDYQYFCIAEPNCEASVLYTPTITDPVSQTVRIIPCDKCYPHQTQAPDDNHGTVIFARFFSFWDVFLKNRLIRWWYVNEQAIIFGLR